MHTRCAMDKVLDNNYYYKKKKRGMAADRLGRELGVEVVGCLGAGVGKVEALPPKPLLFRQGGTLGLL